MPPLFWSRWQLACSLFWQTHPALFYGLLLLLGCYGAFFPIEALLFALIFIFAPLWPCQLSKRGSFWIGLGVAFTSWLFVTSYYAAPQLPSDGFIGRAAFKIESMLGQTPSSVSYKGVLQNFVPSSLQANFSIRHVPFTIRLKDPLPRSERGVIYEAEGTLTQKSRTSYHFCGFSSSKAIETTPVSWQDTLKQQLDLLLRSHIGQGTTYAFLKGLATGQVIDAELQFEFGRFGLQHLMVVSGFHFSLLAAFFTFVLRFIFQGPLLLVLLAILLTFYATVMGISPSLGRAWIGSLCLLLGMLLEQKSPPLNTMGVGMIVMFCISPLSCLDLSFQFTFLCTAAILFFYRPIERLLRWLWPPCPFQTYLASTFYQKITYLALTLLRKSLSLTLAVHLAAAPLALFAFGKFPMMSLIYNLFYPCLASLALTLLLLALIFTWVPFIASFFYWMTKIFSDWMLNLTRLLPQRLDTVLEGHLPTGALVIYFIIFLMLGILCSTRDDLQIRLDENTAF